MLHGSEMLGQNASDLRRLRRKDHCMTQSKQPRLYYSTPETWRWWYNGSPSQPAVQMVWTCTTYNDLYQICYLLKDSWHQRARTAHGVWMCEEWFQRMCPIWHWTVGQRCMEVLPTQWNGTRKYLDPRMDMDGYGHNEHKQLITLKPQAISM